jgi:hypothetical protein
VFWWRNLRERDPLEDPGVDGRIIKIWIFRKLVGAGNGLIWLRIGDRWWALVKSVVKF